MWRIAVLLALKMIWGEKNVEGIIMLSLSISRTLTYNEHVSLDVARVCKLKEMITSVFFKYDEWKPNINYTELKSLDPNSRQTRTVAGSDQQCGLDKIMTLF
jgi:hypothetical protein